MNWGLVLSGGVAYGIANVGVLSVLEEANLQPDAVAGSSMGSIVAALYALGYSTRDMLGILETVRPQEIATWSATPLRDGLHGGVLRQRIRELLEPYVRGATIGDCRIPFVCVAGRVREPIRWHRIIQHGFIDYVRELVEPHVFGPHVPILDAIQASSAIPVVFSPMIIDGQEYVDLVTFGAVPSRTLRALYRPDIVIATNTNDPYRPIQPFLPTGWQQLIAAGEASLQESLAVCDHVIRPALPQAQSFRFDRAREFADIGRTAALQSLPEIQRLIGHKKAPADGGL